MVGGRQTQVGRVLKNAECTVYSKISLAKCINLQQSCAEYSTGGQRGLWSRAAMGRKQLWDGHGGNIVQLWEQHCDKT